MRAAGDCCGDLRKGFVVEGSVLRRVGQREGFDCAVDTDDEVSVEVVERENELELETGVNGIDIFDSVRMMRGMMGGFVVLAKRR